MLANLVVHPSSYNGNQSQQGLQLTHLVKHQSEINQLQARQAIPECNCPIRDLESQTHYLRMHKARQAIPKCIVKMHQIKEATEAQNFRQAVLQKAEIRGTSRAATMQIRREAGTTE